MNEIRIETTATQIRVTSPYHPDWPARARQIDGKWNGDAWLFDPRDEHRVRQLCREIYGTDGTPTNRVTLRHSVTSAESNRRTLWLYGREIADKPGRDIPPRLGDGVIILEGSFPKRSGSRQHPTLGGAGVVLEIRDVPATLVDPEGDDEILEILPAEPTTNPAPITVTLSPDASARLRALRPYWPNGATDAKIIEDALTVTWEMVNDPGPR